MNENAYELVDVPALPSRASSGGKKSKFIVIDTMPVGKGIYVDPKDIGAARSYCRSRSKIDPKLNLVSRRITSGDKAGSFLLARLEDKPVPTAPETPAA